MSRTALVLGANGQDGSFLVRHLLARDYRVMGVGVEPGSRFPHSTSAFTYRTVDLRESAPLERVLEEAAADLVFHVAAVHTSASGGAYEPVFQEMLPVNVGSVHLVLEYLRRRAPMARLLYASSGKVFGEPFPEFMDEDTPVHTSCLYTLTKNAARDLIHYYRRQHGARASVVYLFNHESSLRPPEFFFPKLVGCLLGALRRNAEPTTFATLDFYRDWGSADEYMELAVDLLEQAPGEDFLLATGRCTFARELVRDLFAEHGLDYRQFVREGSTGGPPARPYVASTTKLRASIGRTPQVGIAEVVRAMLREAREAGTRQAVDR